MAVSFVDGQVGVVNVGKPWPHRGDRAQPAAPCQGNLISTTPALLPPPNSYLSLFLFLFGRSIENPAITMDNARIQRGGNSFTTRMMRSNLQPVVMFSTRPGPSDDIVED